MKKIVDGFEMFWGFPQAAGAIDGSHIPIIRPEESASDYYNRKGYYSIIVQALVDHLGLFMDVCIGWPGKVHDARVFVNSSLSQGENFYTFPRLEEKHLWSRGRYMQYNVMYRLLNFCVYRCHW